MFQSGSYDASVVLVPRNDGTDQVDALFTGIQVLSIAVDGNNNKWFGLESGVYEMSPDCKTQLLYFKTHNSHPHIRRLITGHECNVLIDLGLCKTAGIRRGLLP